MSENESETISKTKPNNDQSLMSSSPKKEKSKNETYSKLLIHMQNLQPSANKKIKKKTYQLILTFANDSASDLTEECLDLIIRGDRKKHLIGLCELCNKKTSRGHFKGSTKEVVSIIHDWMILSSISDKITTEFAINEDYVARMNLGEHYSISSSSTKKNEKQFAQKVIKIIDAMLQKRPSLELSDFIRSGFIDIIKQNLAQYAQEKKVEEEANKDILYAENMVEDVINTICMEPKTWEEAEKLNKKLLTCEFISSTDKRFVDDEKESEMELIENFIDPLNNNQQLNIQSYPEEEVNRLHIQMDSFDPIFFLEKFYNKVNLAQFSQCLECIDKNLSEINQKDETLIDKNIYKYLDCKKLLDNILSKFNNETSNLMNQFNSQASNLQMSINDKLSNVKKSFEMIIKSKLAKEVIIKFAKYFIMKDKIEHCLKFSNVEELADYLKKINVEIKEISQNRLIYGDFYDYFSKHVENFKTVLIEIIKNSPTNEAILKYFKYLLEFDVETDIVDTLINGQKEKMCEKIKTFLEFTENFEIKNFKNFFCDEYRIETLSDEVYSDIIKKSDLNLKTNANSNAFSNNDTSSSSNHKKELINVENIIKALLVEINDFLFTMKVLDESLDLKSTYMQRDTKFETIATEIYFVLFDKLKLFLFSTKFSMEEVIKTNYTDLYAFPSNKQIEAFIAYYNDNREMKNVVFNETFNKNTLQNLSNLIIEIFEKFEYHLSSDIIDSLSENKNVIIEKIFIAFLNEKIVENISYFSNESTITYTDTQLSIFNYSAFSFTKGFMKKLCSSYINIIQFYMNIVTKIRNVQLNHEMIYSSFFLTLKCFVLKFYSFYLTEKKYATEGVKLNCLIVETLRNFNYMKFEIVNVLRALFRGKEKDYDDFLLDFNRFVEDVSKIFIEEYIINAAENLVDVFVNVTLSIENTKYSFYDKYNEMLIENSNTKISKKDIKKKKENLNEDDDYNDDFNKEDIRYFNDARSVVIEMIANVATCVRDFEFISNESSDDKIKTTNKEVIKKIIGLFYEKYIQFTKDNNKTMLCEESPEKDALKYLSQLYLEFDIFNTILSEYSTDLKAKAKMVNEALIDYLSICSKGTKSKIEKVEKNDEYTLYSKEDLEKKKAIIVEYKSNYASLFKCFIH